MTIYFNHNEKHEPEELGENQLALADITGPDGKPAQIMVIKIGGRLLHFLGGKPVEEEIMGWHALNESR